ncbi:hypothetical protein KQI38_07665 [Tissierella carlieri]|uniref:hypothetical protein n=1 Tax=Tissierella carlieri TaxID=689904 RepID=UPI001C11BA8F|nr:hypothetical protein [Tissierella carlieri]MBU5311904.1 hypothetical protein [Tissierella carlieri]
MEDNIVIRNGLIDPNYPGTVEKIMRKYPKYYPVMILPGEIHLTKVKNESNVVKQALT